MNQFLWFKKLKKDNFKAKQISFLLNLMPAWLELGIFGLDSASGFFFSTFSWQNFFLSKCVMNWQGWFPCFYSISFLLQQQRNSSSRLREMKSIFQFSSVIIRQSQNHCGNKSFGNMIIIVWTLFGLSRLIKHALVASPKLT